MGYRRVTADHVNHLHMDPASDDLPGIPVRNMHTISELGHTGDVQAATHGIYQVCRAAVYKLVSFYLVFGHVAHT